MNEAMEQVPGFLFFDHVAVSVKAGELEPQVNAYKAMGFKEVHREDVLGGDQVREVLLQVGDGPNLVQLLEPLSPESPVAKQLEKNGGRGGLAHVAFRVTDVGKAFDYLKENGFKVIDKAPRKGSRGTTVFFVHPKTTETAAFGYLFEVVQEGLNTILPKVFDHVRRLNDAFGTGIDMNGPSLDHIALRKFVESSEIEFDENGVPDFEPWVLTWDELRQSVTFPELFKQFPPRTPEEIRAWEELIEKKRVEFNAKRRYRKLS